MVFAEGYAVRPGFVTSVAKRNPATGCNLLGRARMRSESVETMFLSRGVPLVFQSCPHRLEVALRLTTPGESESRVKWRALFMRLSTPQSRNCTRDWRCTTHSQSVYNYEAANWDRMSGLCPVVVETISACSPIRRSPLHT